MILLALFHYMYFSRVHCHYIVMHFIEKLCMYLILFRFEREANYFCSETKTREQKRAGMGGSVNGCDVMLLLYMSISNTVFFQRYRSKFQNNKSRYVPG